MKQGDEVDKYRAIEKEISCLTQHMANLMTFGQQTTYVKNDTGFDVVRKWINEDLEVLFNDSKHMLNDMINKVKEERIKDAIEQNKVEALRADLELKRWL